MIIMENVVKILKQEKAEQEIQAYKKNEINWVDDDYWDSWDKIKGHAKNLWGHKEEYAEYANWKKFFLAHSKDTIKGKPQLIENVQKRIPLIRLVINEMDEKEWDESKGKEIKTGNKIKIQSFFYFDEKFDKRYDGFQKDCFALDFWLYRITTKEGKEHYIFTQEQLPNCTCTFKGMDIELDDFAEISRNMKIKSLSRIFFMKECEPDIKILMPEQLITYTKEREITEKDWLEFLAYHPLGDYNRFPKDTELLKSAFVLAGKVDDYPFHIGIVGPTGTKKSMGFIETTAYKFSEDPKICEGGNSRIKALMPSFKEKPANIGYLAKQERIGFIDEIGKMVEFELNKHQTTINNILGDLNFLLDHKKRVVGSGNDNDCDVQAIAKFMFVTNPISNKSTIYDHVGIIDSTTMSRIFWWVQDKEETEFVLSEKGIVRVPPTPKQAPTHRILNGGIIENRKMSIVLKKCWGKVGSREEFLTLFDSCYSFCCEMDEGEITKLVNITTQLAKEPMKTSVWKPRAYHHVKLLVDGLCKHRCLFKDYDSSFVAKQEDYDLAERILIRMINSWDTNLAPKEKGWRGSF